MRLINTRHLTELGPPFLFEKFGDDIPKYAILSHRWGSEEVTFQDMTIGNQWLKRPEEQKEGYIKLLNTASVAIEYGHDWLWCDTCCIDKSSSAELTESINSMFQWYQNSQLCFAYLGDITSTEHGSFTQSVWFERCWTLQELIAPNALLFFDQSWMLIGNKNQLVVPIINRTGIDEAILTGKRKRLDRLPIARRMSWASARVAQRVEDVAYSLLGIFGVSMPMLYGEGEKAFLRLQEEIIERSTDQSIFLWNSTRQNGALFASSPADFKDCGEVPRAAEAEAKLKQRPFTLNNLGLDIKVPLRPWRLNTYLAFLAYETGDYKKVSHLTIVMDSKSGHLYRTQAALRKPPDRLGPYIVKDRQITILRHGLNMSRHRSTPVYGFRLTENMLNLQPQKNWDPANTWDLGNWSRDEKNNMVFAIPPNVSASIAMLTLELGDDVFLIQLTYDFDFNPAVNISKMNLSFLERFRRKPQWVSDADEVFTWADRTEKIDWTTSIWYQHSIYEDPYNLQRCWIAKSVDRGPFTALVPVTITKPHTNLEIAFTDWPHDGDVEWQFRMRKLDAVTQEP